MADKSPIEWTDATWNPVVGCSIKSPGCIRCYAMKAAHRLGANPKLAGKYGGLTEVVKGKPIWNGVVRLHPESLDQIARWKDPRLIFVNSMSDLFHESLPKADTKRVAAAMRDSPQHVYQILTKRPDIAADFVEQWIREHTEQPPSNWWFGTSVERQQEADERRPHLKRIADRGALTWVSYEPALGPVDWAGWEFIRWLVSGGESDKGPDARPHHPDWHRRSRDWCAAHGIAYHFKQHGDWIDADAPGVDMLGSKDSPLHAWPDGKHMVRIGKKAAGRLLDGIEHNGYPS